MSRSLVQESTGGNTQVGLGYKHAYVGIYPSRHACCSARVLPPRACLYLLLIPTLQVAGAVSSLFILLIIVKLGELFRDLPKVSLYPSQPGFMALARPAPD
jgi:hypothetical protein